MAILNHNNNQIPIFPVYKNGIDALHLNKTLIQGKPIKEIPPEISNFKPISKLDISNNQIEVLPKELFELTNLTLLYFYNNKIKEVPSEIGLLTKLTHLNIKDNDIEFLPPEISNLKHLVHFDISNTKLPKPPNYKANTPQDTIKYILENQVLPVPPAPPISFDKAYFFKNIQKKKIEDRFNEKLLEYSKEVEVQFIDIHSLEDINTSINIIFILLPFDSHENHRLVFDILKKCKELKINFYVLLQTGFIEQSFSYINRLVGEINEKNETEIEENYIDRTLEFSSYDELKGNILSGLKQHNPKVRLEKLTLINIGHFEHIVLDFDEDITLLVGENGTGKSTILRSIGLGLIGSKHRGVKTENLESLLRITGIDADGKSLYEKGLISLDYFIDGEKHTNEITFIPNPEGTFIDIVDLEKSQIVSGEYNLKSLIVGFPQLRSEIIKSTVPSTNKITTPNISDISPIIYSNEQDYRLNSFISWIVNLDVKALQEEEKHASSPDDVKKDNKERAIIEMVFNIISSITKHDIKYIKVKNASPPDVWVSTYDSPHGVPLSMVSQGFKIIMSWVGYYLERIIESFPALGAAEAMMQPAILVLDEIDTSIHPKWQAEFISILRDNFTNTQFVFSTHSPLITSRLNREQILELELNEDNVVSLVKNGIDTWSLSYDDILNKIFNTQELPPLYNLEQLEDELKLLDKSDDKTKHEIQENIRRLIESEQYKDRLTKYENELKQKKIELDDIIKELKSSKN